MGVPKPAKPVKLVCGILARKELDRNDVESALESRFGPIDLRSERHGFTVSSYYESEMGPNLQRWWVAFDRMVTEEDLAPAKLATNGMELKFAVENGGRRVNLDPGYIVPSRLVLATTKDFAHRVYISDGIYGEVTLVWHPGGFESMDWTYPDYRSEDGLRFFARVRARFMDQIESSQTI